MKGSGVSEEGGSFHQKLLPRLDIHSRRSSSDAVLEQTRQIGKRRGHEKRTVAFS